MKNLMQQYKTSCEQLDISHAVALQNLSKIIIPALELYADEIERSIKTDGQPTSFLGRITRAREKERLTAEVDDYRNAIQIARDRISLVAHTAEKNTHATQKPC
mgnify:CR=1 FL=1